MSKSGRYPWWVVGGLATVTILVVLGVPLLVRVRANLPYGEVNAAYARAIVADMAASASPEQAIARLRTGATRSSGLRHIVYYERPLDVDPRRILVVRVLGAKRRGGRFTVNVLYPTEHGRASVASSEEGLSDTDVLCEVFVVNYRPGGAKSEKGMNPGTP